MEILLGNRVRVNGGKNADLLGRIGTVTKLPSTPDGEYEITFDTNNNEDQAVVVERIFESDFEHLEENQPSPVPSSGEEDTTTTPVPGESTTPTAPPAGEENNQEDNEEEEATTTWPAWPARKEATGISLSQVDKSTWIGRPVMVMKGPKTGSMGRVYSTASGWVEIHEAGKDGSDPFLITASGGEAPPINKRAHELNLMKLFNEDDEDNDDDGMGSVERVDSKDFQVGDLVVVLEGAHEGKNGKITEIDGDQLALSIKAVSAIVHKTKNQVEHKKDVRPVTPAVALQRRGPKKKEAGADLLGKKVMVMDTGKVGIVVKCGHGLFEVEVNGEDSIGEMKRRDELRVLDDDEAAAAAAEEDSGEDEANGNGSAANRVRRKRKLRAPANINSMVAAAEEEEKKRPRITRRSGGPQAAASASVAGGGGNKKQTLNADALAVTKLEATRKQRQEIMTSFVMRCKERQDKQMPNRENLQEWLDDIKSYASTCRCCTGNAAEDTTAAIPLLFDFAYCNTCRVEKHNDAEFCWNPACWKSPVFRQDAVPLVEDAYPRELISNIFVNPSTQVKISPLVTLSLMEKDEKQEEEEVTGFFGNGVQDEDQFAWPGFARAHALDRRWKRQQA